MAVYSFSQDKPQTRVAGTAVHECICAVCVCAWCDCMQVCVSEGSYVSTYIQAAHK